MKNIRYFTQKYVDWVIRLGRLRFSLLGVALLAVLALCTQALLSIFIIGKINWADMIRSIVFGLISAPFVIYFFTLLVEKLERSRQDLKKLVDNLRNEVSERVLAEKKLSIALDNIEKTSRDKTQLMATISHELRTPLNGIIGLSRILLDSELTDKQRDYLKTIHISAISLGHIFSDIIDLEKIDARRIELSPKEVELQHLLADISNFGTLMAADKKLCFQLIESSPLPQWLMLDYARVSQILWNLIGNAVKFTSKGSVQLNVSTNENNIYFIVSDTGVGIPQEELHRVFEMYYQVKSSGQKPLGSGIGLAVSKTIAQLMGGDLTVESELGKGASFTLTLPLKEVNKPTTRQNQLPEILSILLVEDIEVNVVVAKSVLEKLGYTVDVAMTGADAIAKFEQHYYDLVLLDIQLPDMLGFDVAQKLREGYEEGIYDFLPPLVALTANVMQSKQEYQSKGMDDVLRKPLVLDELTTCLSEFFGDMVMPMQVSKPVQLETQKSVFDVNMLSELIDMLGVNFVKNNLQLFQQTMPEYMNELLTNYQAYQNDPTQKDKVLSAAHKMKGAAASVGLKRIQQIAAQAQNPEVKNWESNIGDWIAQIEQVWQQDVAELFNWLDSQTQ
ncbi:ATP-binding protein [Pasteurella dagmatis]|uniref:Aerobic respiration control sensor protein n=1 Tax=Pasteurella dagmatis ATCC 43325 TaxID=667128 RepID=C9PQ68_9PAST|nr:ATP-binding protein [Pasteurella dagmatis]EEX50295.1 ATPase/histidine kinase/DNA gyrase B/HSP90 domain protein [Pasteurella dagmatis ATCC 43325]SNV55171.1 sensor histidine kinase-like protein [Pasteurella dagmatis]